MTGKSLAHRHDELAALAQRICEASGLDEKARRYEYGLIDLKIVGLDILQPEAFVQRQFCQSLDDARDLRRPGWLLRVTEARFGVWNVELWEGDKSTKTPADVQALAMEAAAAETAAWLRAWAFP